MCPAQLTLPQALKTLSSKNIFKNCVIRNVIFTADFTITTTTSVATWSKAQVYGRSPAEIVGSNPTLGMDVCRECGVLSGRGLCDGLIIRSEESYQLWRAAVCDQVTSYARRLKPDRGL